MLFSCYALSRGNPIEDAKVLFRQVREAIGDGEILGLAITGYGKDLLKDILGADCPVVETIAHASAGLHYFPDADCICDVGGVDVKIMILNNGAVTDFRLNSQCSSGNGAFLQGVAERFNIPMSEMADRAFHAKSMPQLSMGCGVFLQSDIVNQQRKGWQADEILAGLCAILPLNVWIYAGGLNNLKPVGSKYILQGGTHKNLAVVKTQVDFILEKFRTRKLSCILIPAKPARLARPWSLWNGGKRADDQLSRLRRHRAAHLQDGHFGRHRLSLVPGELPAQFHRRGTRRRQRPRVEQGSPREKAGSASS